MVNVAVLGLANSAAPELVSLSASSTGTWSSRGGHRDGGGRLVLHDGGRRVIERQRHGSRTGDGRLPRPAKTIHHPSESGRTSPRRPLARTEGRQAERHRQRQGTREPAPLKSPAVQCGSAPTQDGSTRPQRARCDVAATSPGGDQPTTTPFRRLRSSTWGSSNHTPPSPR